MGVRFGPGLFERRPTVCVCIDSSVASRQAAQWAATFLRNEAQTMRLLTVVQPSAASQLLSAVAGGLPTDTECKPDSQDLERAQVGPAAGVWMERACCRCPLSRLHCPVLGAGASAGTSRGRGRDGGERIWTVLGRGLATKQCALPSDDSTGLCRSPQVA